MGFKINQPSTQPTYCPVAQMLTHEEVLKIEKWWTKSDWAVSWNKDKALSQRPATQARNINYRPLHKYRYMPETNVTLWHF